MKNHIQKEIEVDVLEMTQEKIAAMTAEYMELCKRQDYLMSEIFNSLTEK